MSDDRFERLLRGYGLPEAPPGMDLRVLAEAERILARARVRAAAAGVARAFGNALGFGYVNYLVDLVTATDAEYRVDLI
ncbi:MAG: hypothetical protein HZB25_06945 [Candidatus Eisenbacteria bacterium]|nr:hypothetical protein [Candidatus Eisenbacteria bacterium]